MLKDKIAKVCNYIVKHCAVVFPVLVIAMVAVTVSAALNANRMKETGDSVSDVANTAAPQDVKASAGTVQETSEHATAVPAPEEVPLTENTDEEIFWLVASYYNAMAQKDMDTLKDIHDSLSAADILRFEETSAFIDGYAAFDIYVKRGLTEDSTLACVYYRVVFLNHPEEFPGSQTFYLSRNAEGKLYIKNDSNFTEEEKQYIMKVVNQDDVKDFHNHVDNEYSELMFEHPELIDYLGEMSAQIDKAVGNKLVALGVAMAEQNMEENGESGGAESSGGDPAQEPGQREDTEAAGNSVVNGPGYAVASTTVNVRESDSEKAEKIGKVSGGSKVQVQVVQLNGWTKIVFEGKDGYIKTEFLQLEEGTNDLQVIGKVTATTNINVRAAASSSAERLGLLSKGKSLDLLAVEDGWCKVMYNGQVAYVSAEFVTQD